MSESDSYIQMPSCNNCGRGIGREQFEAWKGNQKAFGRKHIFCSRGCYFKFHNGKNHTSWKGGKFTVGDGYTRITVGRGKSIDEHISVMEKHLGRRLRTGEMVHHIDGDKTNNRKGNLMLTTRSYNNYLHNVMAMLYAKQNFGGKN